MIIDDNHSSVRYSSLVHAFCKDLFKKTPLKFFIYARFYRDGSVINLTNHPEWHKYYRKKDYHLHIDNRLMPGAHIWRSNKKLSKQVLEAQKKFDIYNKMEIIENYGDYIESFGYGGGNEDGELDDFYLNHLCLLKTHNKSFLSKAFDIIKIIQYKGEYLKVNINNFPCKKENNIQLDLPSKCTAAKLTFADSSINETYNNKISITPKQFDFLCLKLRGYSNNFIAKKLNCTVDNIKHYNKVIRKKLNLKNEETLYTKCEQMGIIDVSKNYKSLL